MGRGVAKCHTPIRLQGISEVCPFETTVHIALIPTAPPSSQAVVLVLAGGLAKAPHVEGNQVMAAARAS